MIVEAPTSLSTTRNDAKKFTRKLRLNSFLCVCGGGGGVFANTNIHHRVHGRSGRK